MVARGLCCVLLLVLVQAGWAGAQCVLGTEVDGYLAGWVRAVAYSVDPIQGCVTDVTVDIQRSSLPLPQRPTLRMLGGWCNGKPCEQQVFPGGRKTFSMALDELAYLAFCQDDTGILWILDKGTLWSEVYPADTTGVQQFARDVSQRRVNLDELGVYRCYVMEVMRAPDPTAFYADRRMRRDTWFLQHVKYGEKPAPALSRVVDALGLND